MHPEILVTGMPNSGTSFMTELVVGITGLSPGLAPGLKRGDKHNPYGYWEYLPLRDYIWESAGGRFSERCIPLLPMPFKEVQAAAIADMAAAAGVKVLKCFMLPWVYEWFGEPRQVVLTRRNATTLHTRYYQKWPLNEYRAVHTRFYDLAAKFLDQEWDVLWMEYEDFSADTEGAIRRVCDFLGCPFTPALTEIWRPRCS